MKKKMILIIGILLLINVINATNFSWFSQNDSRWKYNTLGRSTSIGRSGCVVSCLSMLLNAEASNPYMTPDKLNSWLRKNGGYSGNNMRWQIPGLIDGEGLGMELEGQSTRYNDWDFLSSELEKGNKVIVKVAGRRSHWVLVVKQEGEANKASSYLVNDPGMTTFEKRTLAYWGGFRSSRSYSGNWLDEQAFMMNSEIHVVPIASQEGFLYDIIEMPHPADVFVTIQNNLAVDIHGYFILGLFDADDNLIDTIDYEYSSIEPEGEVDLLYEMTDYTPLQDDSHTLKVIYSKYFSKMPSMYDTINLESLGINNLTKPLQAAGER
jgi:hypothetical protein